MARKIDSQVFKIDLPLEAMQEIRAYANEMKAHGYSKQVVYGYLLKLGYEQRAQLVKRMVQEAGK